jgi:hypothetical protein
MPDTRKEQERTEFHRTIWAITNDLSSKNAKSARKEVMRRE